MRHFHLFLLLLVFSCGGGGGGTQTPDPVAFALTLASGIFTTDEDTDLNGSIAANANEAVTITYAITSSVTSGVLTLSTNGDIKYIPNTNFFGTDSFEYSVSVPEKNITRSDAEMIRNCVIYKDDYLLVLNKPAGLAVQGGSKQTRHVDGMTGALTFEREEAPRLVHRLDKDTSGLLLIARNAKAAEILTAAFKNKTIRKTYVALVLGVPKKEEGVINIPICKKFASSSVTEYVNVF